MVDNLHIISPEAFFVTRDNYSSDINAIIRKWSIVIAYSYEFKCEFNSENWDKNHYLSLNSSHFNDDDERIFIIRKAVKSAKRGKLKPIRNIVTELCR